MKKFGITILLIALGGMGLTMAQQGRQGQVKPEIKKYFEENILPVVETEQQNFYKALSADEMKKVEDLKVQLDTRIQRMQQGKGQGNGKGMGKGNGQGRQQQGRAAMQLFFDEADAIAEAHPKEMKHFQQTMDVNKDKWISDITAIRKEISAGNGRGRFGQESPMFDHFSSPGWLLLWDKDRQDFQQMARMGRGGKGMHGRGMGRGNGMHGNGMCEGGRHGKGMGKGMGMQGGGMHNGMGPNQNVNPELRAEIREYAQQNIIPVIAKEREAFDSNLSDTEKEQIALAQGKRKARRIMFREWYKSEDFEPGARRDDPNFDMMREDMQKSMTELRAIADAHSAEIEKAMNDIRTYSKVWEPEIKAIAAKYQNDRNNNFMGFAHQMRQMASPVHFLLFNSKEAENTTWFDIDRKDMVMVDIYPNPATSHATIRISGVNNRQTEVKLYSREGDLIKTLYNEQVIGEEVTFGFSVADLDNNIYIIKVKSGENVIARKIIVQK
jgi:hypothetical protein